MKLKSAEWERIGLAAWCAIALATLLSAIAVSYVGSIGAPTGDEWRFTNPDQYLSELTEKYHGHPLVVGRLALAVDYWLFAAQGWALRVATFLALALWAGSMLAIARVASPLSPRAQALLGAAAFVLAFNPQAAQNLYWGFQIAFVMAFAAGAAAIASLAAYAAAPRLWKLLAAFAFSVVAPLSLGSGLFAPVALLLMALALKLPTRLVIAFAVLVAATWAGFFLTPGPSGAQRIEFGGLVEKIKIGFGVLGCAPGLTLGYVQQLFGHNAETPYWSIAFGVAEIAAALWLGFLVARDSHRSPGSIGALALIFFAMASAGALALVREDVSRHYVAISSTMIAGLGILAVSYFPAGRARAGAVAVAATTLFAVMIPLSAGPLLEDLTARQNARTLAQTALVVGSYENARDSLFSRIRPRLVRRATADLRTRAKWLFRDEWSRRLMSTIDVGAARPCANGRFRINGDSEDDAFARLGGRISPSDRRAARAVVVLNSDQVMIGYGLVPKRPEYLFGGGGASANWVGFARRGEIDQEIKAYLASNERILCQIGRGAMLSAAPPETTRAHERREPQGQ